MEAVITKKKKLLIWSPVSIVYYSVLAGWKYDLLDHFKPYGTLDHVLRSWKLPPLKCLSTFAVWTLGPKSETKEPNFIYHIKENKPTKIYLLYWKT
jgi:hypothetical protein